MDQIARHKRGLLKTNLSKITFLSSSMLHNKTWQQMISSVWMARQRSGVHNSKTEDVIHKPFTDQRLLPC